MALFFLLLLFLCFTAGVRVGQAAPPVAAPSPILDCSSELFKLIDCLPFVRNGSNATEPGAQCCSSLSKVVREAPACLCNLSSQGQGQGSGLNVNVTKASTLPSACGISTLSASYCNISGAPPASAPGQSASCVAPSSASGVEFLSGFAVALWLYYQSR